MSKKMLKITEKYIVKNGKRHYLCICDCGKEVYLRKDNFKRNISCGCYNKSSKTKHGMSGKRLYTIYSHMVNRCYNENDKNYKDYGGRGIHVCEEWLKDINNFVEWANKNGYKESLTIERIDVNKNYEPDNCKWCTREEQSNNTRRNNYYTAFGETGTIRYFCNKYNISYNALRTRLYRKTMEEAILMGKEKEKYKIKKYTIRGITGTRKEICDTFGVNYYTVKSRMNIYGMTLEEALFQNMD